MEDTSSQLSALRSEIALLKQTNKNLEKDNIELKQMQRDSTEAQVKVLVSAESASHSDGIISPSEMSTDYHMKIEELQKVNNQLTEEISKLKDGSANGINQSVNTSLVIMPVTVEGEVQGRNDIGQVNKTFDLESFVKNIESEVDAVLKYLENKLGNNIERKDALEKGISLHKKAKDGLVEAINQRDLVRLEVEEKLKSTKNFITTNKSIQNEIMMAKQNVDNAAQDVENLGQRSDSISKVEDANSYDNINLADDNSQPNDNSKSLSANQLDVNNSQSEDVMSSPIVKLQYLQSIYDNLSLNNINLAKDLENATNLQYVLEHQIMDIDNDNERFLWLKEMSAFQDQINELQTQVDILMEERIYLGTHLAKFQTVIHSSQERLCELVDVAIPITLPSSPQIISPNSPSKHANLILEFAAHKVKYAALRAFVDSFTSETVGKSLSRNFDNRDDMETKVDDELVFVPAIVGKVEAGTKLTNGNDVYVIDVQMMSKGKDMWKVVRSYPDFKSFRSKLVLNNPGTKHLQ